MVKQLINSSMILLISFGFKFRHKERAGFGKDLGKTGRLEKNFVISRQIQNRVSITLNLDNDKPIVRLG